MQQGKSQPRLTCYVSCGLVVVFTTNLLDKVGDVGLGDDVDVKEPLCTDVRGYLVLTSTGQDSQVQRAGTNAELDSRDHQLVDDQDGEEPRDEPGQALNDPT